MEAHASPTLSSDGQWFARKLTPNRNDSEVVLRRLSDGKEWRFAAAKRKALAAAGFSAAAARRKLLSRTIQNGSPSQSRRASKEASG
jgi:hypothetical protein